MEQKHYNSHQRMAYNNRKFFSNESVEDKTRKYTRPHPVVTSHLRNLRQSVQNTPPIWVSPMSPATLPMTLNPQLNNSPVMHFPVLRSPNLYQTISQHQGMQDEQRQQVINVQQQLGNRKRKYSPPIINVDDEQTLEKRKREYIIGVIDKCAKLTSEMNTYYQNHSQSPDLLQKKLRLRSALLTSFRKQLNGASLHLVGSSCNGFAGSDSDADFCVMLTQNRHIDQKYEACRYLQLLQRTLRTMPCMKKVLLIRAKVPILKFTDTVSGCDCDVNINNSIGIRNTHLLRTYSKVDNRVIPMVVVVKHWAKSRSINDASSGTLSSYSIVLMVIHYLQSGCTPPVLTSLQKDYPQYFGIERSVDELPMFEPAEYIPCNRSNNHQSLGELLCGFFKYYAVDFRFDFLAVSIRLGRATPKSAISDINKDKFICIEEPFDKTNTARAVYKYDSFVRITKEFKRAHNRISEDPSLGSIL